MNSKVYQFLIGLFLQIDRSPFRFAIGNLENSPIGSVVSVWIVVVALVFVVPIDHVNCAVGTGLEIDDLGPAIVKINEVMAVVADKAGALALRDIHVDASAMDVVHEKFAAILLWPIIFLINQHASMGMAAACSCGT